MQVWDSASSFLFPRLPLLRLRLVLCALLFLTSLVSIAHFKFVVLLSIDAHAPLALDGDRFFWVDSER